MSKPPKPESVQRLNDAFRHGGNLSEAEPTSRDMVSEMGLLARDHRRVAAALEWMGITENGDEPEDK